LLRLVRERQRLPHEHIIGGGVRFHDGLAARRFSDAQR
jgi:hypothetical protein